MKDLTTWAEQKSATTMFWFIWIRWEPCQSSCKKYIDNNLSWGAKLILTYGQWMKALSPPWQKFERSNINSSKYSPLLYLHFMWDYGKKWFIIILEYEYFLYLISKKFSAQCVYVHKLFWRHRVIWGRNAMVNPVVSSLHYYINIIIDVIYYMCIYYISNISIM